jgi:hypothetical protein
MRILSVAGMELCWLYAVFAVVQAQACSRFAFMTTTLVFYLLAFGIQRYLLKAKGKILVQHILGWFFWLFFALLFASLVENDGAGLLNRIFSWATFPSPELLALAGSAVSWGGGKRISRVYIDDSVMLSEFQFGLFMLLVAFFLEGQWQLQLGGLVPLTMVFIFFALGGLPAGLLHVGSRTSTSRRIGWFGIVAGSICIVLAAGLLASSILKPEFINLLLSIAEAVGRFIGGLILKIIDFLMSFLPQPEPQSLKDLPDLSLGIRKEPPLIVKILTIPESVRKVANVLMAAIWIGLILAALWSLSKSLLNWLLKRGAYPDGMEVETLSGAFREDLYALLKWLAWRMDRVLTKLLSLFGFRRVLSVAAPDVSSARALYRQLLRWSVKKGCARQKAQTPGEYLDVLAERMPGGYNEFALITSTYMEERYSPVSASSDALERTRACWRRVKRKRRKELNRREAGKSRDEKDQRSEVGGQRSAKKRD